MVITWDFDRLHHGLPALAIANPSSKSCFHFAQSPRAAGTNVDMDELKQLATGVDLAKAEVLARPQK